MRRPWLFCCLIVYLGVECESRGDINSNSTQQSTLAFSPSKNGTNNRSISNITQTSDKYSYTYKEYRITLTNGYGNPEPASTFGRVALECDSKLMRAMRLSRKYPDSRISRRDWSCPQIDDSKSLYLRGTTIEGQFSFTYEDISTILAGFYEGAYLFEEQLPDLYISVTKPPSETEIVKADWLQEMREELTS